MLVDLKEYQFVGILLGLIQKIETRLLGSLGKSISESCQENYVLLWDMFSYCYMFVWVVERAYVELQSGSHPEIWDLILETPRNLV